MSVLADEIRASSRLEDVLKDNGLSLKEAFELSPKPHVHTHKRGSGCCYVYQGRDGRYVIIKEINGKTCYFGSYYNRYDAIRVSNELQANGWDKDCLEDIKIKFNIKSVVRSNYKKKSSNIQVSLDLW